MIRNHLLSCVAMIAVTSLPLVARADTAAAPAAPAPVSLSTPGMFGPLALNTNPYNFEAGQFGKIYVSGILSGLAMTQDHHVPGDHDSRLDLDNGQVFIQKIDGPVQFFAQVGGYSLPSLGTSYFSMDKTTGNTFGALPVAYLKLAPSDSFSVIAGKLYTLIGTENTFTFQNANIERGLLWNQTNAVNRGIQANYSKGAFSGSVALSDGFYSGDINWLSGLGTYTIDPNNSITVIASGNISRDGTSTFATPLAQNNSQIYDLNYSYTNGPWVLSPTLQYTHVPEDVSIGLAASASTYGAGLTAKYSINSNWNIAGRAEYISSTGSATDGSPNLMYGPGSKAWSFTLTPTYQYKIFFGRAEASYVSASSTTPGSAFGSDGNDKTQGRLLFETGILF